METMSFDKLLLKTAFCCMASDGDIDDREVETIKLMSKASGLFKDFDFHKEINQLVTEINDKSKEFIQEYLDTLKQINLSEQEELMLIDFAIKTIYADEIVQYSEIKFFKNIRHRLKVSNEVILENFPDIEQYLEEDIITDSFLDKITNQYFESANLPKFDLLKVINEDTRP